MADFKQSYSCKYKKQPKIPIENLFNFFKELNAPPENTGNIRFPTIDPFDVNRLNENVNRKITQKEILNCIKKLKNNKAPGEDKVVNEYIKATCNQFIEIYELLFNLVFQTGIIPDSWLFGDIKPIYKNKGDPLNPKNFRPITILSCVGKLFTAILSERLSNFSDECFILCENQIGF